jgi:hypothetical protein
MLLLAAAMPLLLLRPALLHQLLRCCHAAPARCNGDNNVLNDKLLGACVSCSALKLMRVVAFSASAAASLLHGSGCSSSTVPAAAAATRCMQPFQRGEGTASSNKGVDDSTA